MKKRNIRRAVLVAAAIVMMCAGCEASSPGGAATATTTATATATAQAAPTPVATEPPEEGAVVSIVIPASSGALLEYLYRAEEAASELLGAGVRFHMASDLDVVLASGQGCDLIPIASRYQAMTFRQKGYLADISGALDSFPALRAAAPEIAWRTAEFEGGIYAFPLVDDDSWDGTMESGILIRRDIVEALGEEMPTTVQELIDLSAAAREGGLDHEVAAYMLTPPYALHRTYEGWPFFVDDTSLALYGQDGSVSAYVGSDVYLEDAAQMERLAKEGVLLNVTSADDIATLQIRWDVLAALYPIGWPDAGSPHEADVELIQLSPQRENFRMRPCSTRAVGVSYASEDLPLALEVLKALFTRQDVYDAVVYGREGVDYTLQEDGVLRRLDVNLEEWFAHPSLHRPSLFDTPDNALAAAQGPGVEFAAPHYYNGEGAELSSAILSSAPFAKAIALRNGIELPEDLERSSPEEILEDLEEAGYGRYVQSCAQGYSVFLGVDLR